MNYFTYFDSLFFTPTRIITTFHSVSPPKAIQFLMRLEQWSLSIPKWARTLDLCRCRIPRARQLLQPLGYDVPNTKLIRSHKVEAFSSNFDFDSAWWSHTGNYIFKNKLHIGWNFYFKSYFCVNERKNMSCKNQSQRHFFEPRTFCYHCIEEASERATEWVFKQ